jgi:hypothetical protein
MEAHMVCRRGKNPKVGQVVVAVVLVHVMDDMLGL